MHDVALVLGGGGILGSSEVGMLRALVDADVRPDLVLGSSVGAINGAVFAADPTLGTVERMETLWRRLSDDACSAAHRCAGFPPWRGPERTPMPASPSATCSRPQWAATPASRTCRFDSSAWRPRSSTPRSAGFDRGPVVEAVMASSAVPGLLPPAVVDGEHYLDGGLVHSIPIGRAVALGARTIYVLHVGRIERPLEPPRRPWEVAMVAFEIARRHRFAADMAAVPDDVTVHVLPTGDPEPPRYGDLSVLRYRDTSRVAERIRLAHESTAAYLARV